MNMPSVLFVASTLLAGFAFGLAMLWVAAEWLKADGESEVCEEEVRAAVDAPKSVEPVPLA